MKEMNLLSVKEVAKILALSERWVSNACRSGVLPAVKIGKSWRVHETELEEFLRRKGIDVPA